MPRHSPYALVRLNFPILGSRSFFELLEFHKTNNLIRLLILFCEKVLSFCSLNCFPPFGEIVIYPYFLERPLNLTNLLINSFVFVLLSVRFLLFKYTLFGFQ